MKKIYIFSLFLIVIAASCSSDDVQPASSEAMVLKNDSYEKDKNSRMYIPDFEQGEEVAATLGPVNNPFTVTHAEFFFGTTGESRTRDIILKIYKEKLTSSPGNPFFIKRYTITATNEEEMVVIDLTEEQLYIPEGGSIRLSIEITDDGLPSIAHEWTGTIVPQRNWIKTGGMWINSETKGFDKDFILRAVIREGVPPIIND